LAYAGAVKPRVFVSYHHGQDQAWYDLFSGLFAGTYDVFTDTSLERKVDSEDTDYIRQSIREENITGSSLTIVLCGPATWGRRWVDLEIQMTLNKKHALLGLVLPTHRASPAGKFLVPDRLHDNLETGFAYFVCWTEDPALLKGAIEEARTRSLHTGRILNSRPSMKRSSS
jgi:hypothetical protein